MKHFLFVLLNVTHTVDYVTGGPIKLNGSSSIKRSVHLLLDAFLQQKQSICVHFDEFQSLTLRWLRIKLLTHRQFCQEGGDTNQHQRNFNGN